MALQRGRSDRLSETQVWFNLLVVIVGPTAVGKSRIAVEVAKAFETEVPRRVSPLPRSMVGWILGRISRFWRSARGCQLTHRSRQSW